MTRPDAAWNEERYTRYVKAAVFMAYAQNHGGGACIPDIIREFTLEYEVAPDLTRFGHQNLESFLNSKPDIFIKVGIGYGPNEKNLTEAERTQIGNMVSSFRNKRGKAKRGRRGGEGSRGRNPNFGNQTGFSVTAFDASESAFPRREVGNTERGGTSSFQYNQGADIRQNQNQNHGGFEESHNFAVSSNKFHANNQQFDQYNSSGQNYNDFEQFEYGDQKEEFDYEENQAADSEVEQLFHGVSLDTQAEHSAPPAPSPPPGFGTSSVKNSLGTGQPGKTTTATSAVRQKISVGMICRALAYQLWRRWPEAVEENHLLHLIEDDERFSVITRVSDAKKRQNIKNVTARFKKSIWEKFVFIEEKKDGTYYLFKATVSEEGGRREQAKTLTLVISRLLKERGPTSIHYLASAINLEDNEGYAKEDLLDDLLRNHQLLPRIILLDDYTVPGPKAVLMPEATFSNWRPGFPNNMPVERQKRIAARQIPEDVGNNQSGSVFDQRRASGYEARYEENYQEQQYRQENQNGYQQQKNWQETYSGQQEYRNEEIQVAAYLCQNSPLSTILDGNSGDYLIDDKIRVFVAWAVDFNTFWVRTQDDDNEFKRLTDELSYVMEQEARYSVCSDFISVGGLVAFAQYRQNEPPKYYRGRVLNKTRTSIRVECIDLGGLMTVDRYNVYRLPEKFRAAPNLVTRCSLGLFEVQRGWEVDFGREESQIMEFLTFQHADIRIIDAVNGSLIVDLFYQDDHNDYVIPRRFLDRGVIRMR